MTGNFYLDWAAISVSLFNTVLLLWLGLTVLLNAERRTWGLWLAGGGLLAGAVFFVSHSAILGYGLKTLGQGLNFWWRLGWMAVVALPPIWYVITLWYAGYWERTPAGAAMPALQRSGLVVVLLGNVGLAALLIVANTLPAFTEIARLSLSARPAIGGVPLILLAYPVYIVLCIGLSLDALRRPGPSARVMGDLARRRARPWLVATACLLFAISLLVAWAILWAISRLREPPTADLFPDLVLSLGRFDLAIASLIAATVVLVGQAVAAYEVFTGRTLPRRGLLRQWRSGVILAAGFSVVAGWSLTIQLRPIYSLLLTALLLAVFYALFSWRSYAERDRYMRHLRPFVASQHIYEHVLGSASTPSEVDVATPFQALCRDVLGARVAHLVALGPLAPLVPPLHYGEGDAPQAGPGRWQEIAARFDSPQRLCLPLDPEAYSGSAWAVPLWSERGLIGLLLLGEKKDGGLYSQEEIEIARASGERLIDTRASAEVARRLMELQRQRLVESQVLDRRARRVLHDDVLPALHAAMLTLSATGGATQPESLDRLADVHRQIADLLRAEGPGATEVDFAERGLLPALKQAMQEELGRAFDEVAWQVEPEAERAAQAIPLVAAEVVFYAAREAVRNAARHGRASGNGRLRLRIAADCQDGWRLVVEDDGPGVEAGRGAAGGSGQGLALHGALMAVVGGALSAEPLATGGTRVTLSLPLENEGNHR